MPGLPLTDNELLAVVQRDQPSLAAQRAHLTHVIDVNQGLAVYAAKLELCSFPCSAFND